MDSVPVRNKPDAQITVKPALLVQTVKHTYLMSVIVVVFLSAVDEWMSNYFRIYAIIYFLDRICQHVVQAYLQVDYRRYFQDDDDDLKVKSK